MTIAFLGLGRMGRELAAHLVDDGHDVIVWNRTPQATTPLAARGARAAPSAADAARGADVVVTALFGPASVREVVVDGALPLLRDGGTWIDVTTVGPADAEAFAAFAHRAGVHYAHSPVVGSLGPARARSLGVLLGGTAEAVRIARPVVGTWAAPERLRTYPSARQAATAKLVANLTVGVAMQGVVEALRLGHAGGLATEDVLGVLDGGVLAAITALKGDAIRDRAFADTQFSADLFAKDARLMLRTTDLPLPAMSAVHEALETARRAGHGDHDFSIIAAADRRA